MSGVCSAHLRSILTLWGKHGYMGCSSKPRARKHTQWGSEVAYLQLGSPAECVCVCLWLCDICSRQGACICRKNGLLYFTCTQYSVFVFGNVSLVVIPVRIINVSFNSLIRYNNNNNNRRLVTLAEHTSDHGRQTNSSTEEKGEQV